MEKSERALLREEFENDLTTFGLTSIEIDSLMEQCGFKSGNFIIVNKKTVKENVDNK